MTTASQRIHVLVTPAEKRKIAKKAANAGISVEAYLKQAAIAYRPTEDEQILEWMISQMNNSTNRAVESINETLSFVEASNKRIASYEKNSKQS